MVPNSKNVQEGTQSDAINAEQFKIRQEAPLYKWQKRPRINKMILQDYEREDVKNATESLKKQSTRNIRYTARRI